MSLTFGRVDLARCEYTQTLDLAVMDPVPVDAVLAVYRAYCAHRNFHSVIPLVPGRFLVPGTETIGYWNHSQLMAWSMYRIWDQHNLVCDQHAWDYRQPKLRLGIRSLENECALYRDRGFHYMYFETVESYMYDLQGFELLGPWR